MLIIPCLRLKCPTLGLDEPLYRNLGGPNQWPDETVIPGFGNASFKKFFDVPQQGKLKLVKYLAPPEDATIPEGGIQGVGPHQDGSFLTFLLQATPNSGLEVQNKNGDWIKANPIPETLVVSIGQSLQALTGGVCTATTPRVNLSLENFVTSCRSLGPRYSFPVFQGVKIGLEAKDIDLKIPQHIKDLVKNEKVKSKAETTFNAVFRENIVDRGLISRATSHQDMGRRWYPELLDMALHAERDFAG
ncbi:hypothetical protein B0J14DRAFT_622914 [Halenospora varia]|nr:hypothetical protein B0J14DRAFT_622914 [Halenospora varia]